MATEVFRNSKEFTVFKPRNVQAEPLDDDSDQLSPPPPSPPLAKVPPAPKKKFHRRSISLQSIPLSYKGKEPEARESPRLIQEPERTTTTPPNDPPTQEESSKAKGNSRETREETADEEIPRMDRITKQDLQEMLNVAVAAGIAAAAAAIPPQAPTPSSGTIPEQSTPADRPLGRWNPDDIDFFDPNFEGKSASTEEAVAHAGKDTYYRDVHVFVKRVKEMAIVLGPEIVRKNLPSCLRGTTLVWHTSELSDVSRRILSYGENVDEWVQALTNRFKTQATTATANLLKERYTMADAGKNREPREYAQKIIRWAKSAEMSSAFNQLNIVYNGIDPELRRDMRKPTKDTTIDDYLQLLNDCKDIWWSLAGRSSGLRNTDKPFQFNPASRFYENRPGFSNQPRFYN